MTHNILLTRLQGEKISYLPRVGSLRTRTIDAHGPVEEGRMTPTLPPFVRPGSLQSPTFCWMLCDPSVFYRIWFWPLADCRKYKTRWEKFASSYNPLFRVVQITIRATARIARNTNTLLTMKRKKNVVYDVNNVEQHDASPSIPDVIPKRADSLAVVEGMLSRFFLATAAARAIRHVCQARFEVQAAKG